MKHELIKSIKSYIDHLYSENSPMENVYHDFTHTKDVIEAAEKIGKSLNLNEEELQIITIAAYFHDVGYIDTRENHEARSVEIAKNFLAENHVERNKIDKITGCILATKMPQSPKNILEEVICDADLHHLGSKDFFERNEIFRMEVEKVLQKNYSDIQWLQSTIEFMSSHKYFTPYARNKYDEQKQLNLAKLQKRLRKKLEKKEENMKKDEKIEIEKEKIKSKKSEMKKAERGIETMFRNVMRTHVSFSAMADNKANIMISVNTLIITAVIAVLARKLDSNPHLIIPTAILTIFSLTTLIFAVLVTRPKITDGRFTKEDIENKKANLLFFGNFFNVSLEDFNWGMQEMMNDRDYLYESMVKDFYFLGQVLGQKYKYLRICHTIFMYGLILSVLAFAIAIIFYPGATELGSLIE